MNDINGLVRLLKHQPSASCEVSGPADLPDSSGVLVISGDDKKFGVIRMQQPMKKRRDVRVNTPSEAYRQLLIQKFDSVIVLPNAVNSRDELTLNIIRELANGSPVFVFTETEVNLTIRDHSKDSEEDLIHSNELASDSVRHEVVTIGPIIGHRSSGLITANGEPLQLSPSLSRILWRLLESPQHHCKRSELIGAMAYPNLAAAKDTLRVHISRLRKKLTAAGCDGILVTGRGAYWLHWPRTR